MLDNLIEKHHLLSDSQNEFRENRSTSVVLIGLTDEITGCIDNNNYVGGVIPIFLFFFLSIW